MRLLWLPQVLADAGCGTYLMPGWEQRGRDLRTVHGVVWHHTASGPNWNDDHVAFLLRDGRRDLAGPLAQLGLERDGTFVIVAAGRANHNGYGQWGNDSIGIEAYNDGVGEPWAPAQVAAYRRGTAAILRHLRLNPAQRMRGHRETDPRRKIDPAGLDMAAERAAVRTLVDNPNPQPAPLAPTPEEDLMEFFVQSNDPKERTIVHFTGMHFQVLTGAGYEDRKDLRSTLGLRTLPLVQWHPLQILEHIDRHQLAEVPAMVKA